MTRAAAGGRERPCFTDTLEDVAAQPPAPSRCRAVAPTGSRLT